MTAINRADDDQKAFDLFTQYNTKSTTSAKHFPGFGHYPEWEGSEAQHWLKKDMEDGKHLQLKPEELHQSRPEYVLLPLKVFRDHIAQPTRTGKYLYQLKLLGKGALWKEFEKEDP